MARQTSYDEMDVAFAGMKGDIRPDVVESYAVEDSDGIGFGLGVEYGTDEEHQVKVWGDNVFAGFTVHEHREPDSRDDHEGYSQYDTAGVIRVGLVWAQLVSDETPSKGDAVFVVNTGNDAGKVAATDANDGTMNELENAHFYGGAENGLAPVVVNYPSAKTAQSV